MRAANTVQLKTKTNKILREVMEGSQLIITHRGKPAASLTPLKEEDLEDFVLENNRKIRRMIRGREGYRKREGSYHSGLFGGRTAGDPYMRPLRDI